jgi:hypothetical protein
LNRAVDEDFSLQIDPLKANLNVENISSFDLTISLINKSFVVLGMTFCSIHENEHLCLL